MRDRPLDEAMAEWFREDPAYAADLLTDILSGGDQAELPVILRQIALAAGGVQALADKTQLNPTHLYCALSVDGNPSLSNLTAILKAMGLQLIVRPAA
jgi:probable addiction module antidote protein